MPHSSKPPPIAGWATILDALDRHADAWPDKPAFVFLAEGENESDVLTFKQLRDRALTIGTALTSACGPGERALLLYPPGLEFISAFLGCLHAGVIAVPLYAPHPRRPDARLATVSADCGPALILSDSDTLARCANALDAQPSLAGARRLPTNDVVLNGRSVTHEARPQDVAFIQYTSGSTSSPRGVCVTHANLLANERMIQQAMRLDSETVFVSWLPTHHDMGLVGDTLQPIYSGCASYKMPPAAFLQHPRRWLSAITKYRATIVGAPNFGYELCVNRIPPSERETFDLSSLRVTYCGSEPIRAQTLHDFADAFASCGLDRRSLYPCYGMAECTLLATGGPPMRPLGTLEISASALQQHEVLETQEPDRWTMVNCGEFAEGTEIVIVRPETCDVCNAEEVGEIWISGPHVAKGYWANPDATERSFHAMLPDGKGPYLRTGDLGFVRADGLYVTGRLKDVIIIRGRNHYPQDIEHTAQAAHPTLRACMSAAFSIGEPGDEHVVIAQEVPRTTGGEDAAEMKRLVRRAVAEAHEIQPHDVVMIRWGIIPKTTSGKVRRSACREAYLAGNMTEVGTPVAAGADTARGDV